MIHKSAENCSRMPLGRRFNSGHQTAYNGQSLYPVPKDSQFHRSEGMNVSDSIMQGEGLGSLWVDASNTYEDARLSKQPYHLERDTRTMTSYSYSSHVPPGTYVEPKLFNIATHEDSRVRPLNRFQQAALRQDPRSYSVPRRGSQPNTGHSITQYHYTSGVFVGFVEWEMERGMMTAGEMDRVMMKACSSKYPCSRPATYEEFISKSIVGLPEMNRTKRDITFVGPGSTKEGPGVLAHKNTLSARKKIVFPGGRLDGAEGNIEIEDSSCWGRKNCIAIMYQNRVRKQPSLTQFGFLRNSVDRDPSQTRTDETQWDTFNHLYKQ